jgi:hypothetical protein
MKSRKPAQTSIERDVSNAMLAKHFLEVQRLRDAPFVVSKTTRNSSVTCSSPFVGKRFARSRSQRRSIFEGKAEHLLRGRRSREHR